MTEAQAVGNTQQIHSTTGTLLSRLAQWWTALPQFNRKLGMLAGLRIIIALLIMTDILKMPTEMRNGWYLHHGGDQEIMFDLARSIIVGSPAPELIGIGQALVMIPFILIFKPYYYFDFVVPLVLINGFLLASLSVMLIGLITRRAVGNDRAALWASFLWAVLPLTAYFAFFWHPEAEMLRGANIPKIGWLNGLSDPPAAFFLLLSVAILTRQLGKNEESTGWRFFWLGVSLGLAVIFRVHIAFMVVFLLVYVLIVHGWRALLKVSIGGLIAYLPQAWYNTAVFGLPVTTGYLSVYRFDPGADQPRSLGTIISTLPFHPKHLIELTQRVLDNHYWLLIPTAILVGVLIVCCIALYRRRGWRSVALFVGAPLSYIIPMASAWPFRDDIIRFSLPVLPLFIAITVYTLWLLGQYLARRKSKHLRPVQ